MKATYSHAGFVRAYLEIDGGGKLDCYFNPTEYSIAKANTWEPIKVNGKPSPDQKFTSGTPRSAPAEPVEPVLEGSGSRMGLAAAAVAAAGAPAPA